jgi:circadian clock protein KaiA
MILPLLLTWIFDIKKYLYNPQATYKLPALIEQFRQRINELFEPSFAVPLTAKTPLTCHYLHQLQSTNDNLLWADYDKYVYMLACNDHNGQQWFKDMSPGKKQEILEQLKSDYRKILINYFISDKNLKVAIDNFINALFYANIPVPQIIEIHMELIDEFSKQLKLEGRSDETLLDYRLTLIDILAHLCEVYRCAISKDK